MVETISQKIVKARKEHKCSWCHGTISKGEEYENATCKYAGEIYVWKNHLKCRELADNLNMWMHGWDGLNADEFSECIQEYLQENNWFYDDPNFHKGGFENRFELDKEDKLSDWFDDNNWYEWTLKAYEIYKGERK